MLRGLSERMGPGFMSRQQQPIGGALNSSSHPKPPATAQPSGVPQINGHPPPGSHVVTSFNVPLTSALAGPDTEDIVHATTDAVERWTHPLNAPDDVPVGKLPVHARNLEALEGFCRDLTAGPQPTEAAVLTTNPSGLLDEQVTTVCLAGSPDVVAHIQANILQAMTPTLHCTTIDVDGCLFYDAAASALRKDVTDQLDLLSLSCGVDIFLLGPKLRPPMPSVSDAEIRVDQRWRIAIYGDLMASEYAKIRILAHIDRLLGRTVEGVPIDHSLQQCICGRHRRNIKLIEASTDTAIYFAPPFTLFYTYARPGSQVRSMDRVIITGDKPAQIAEAKQRLHDLGSRTRTFVLDAVMAPAKIDSIMLHRLDIVRKIAEANATFVMFPLLGQQTNMIRVQGCEQGGVQRTVREIMKLASQFYSATWFVGQSDLRHTVGLGNLKTCLLETSARSGADISFDDSSFFITGPDEAVKLALVVLSETPFVSQAPGHIKVRIELANEHKEFVSGKKNGKINKIMGQSHVQIIFDTMTDVNFNIEITANNFESIRHGLILVEQEMPASISFHVPDQYHKRIIGIGGQHIQRIMKKHSVFVKFSNAMDRGGFGREDDDANVDNVVCRTPARNAQNLDAVKNEILELVERDDTEYTSQVVNIDRLWHRKLLVRLREVEALESKHGCKIEFPSTEQASDEIKIIGPQWQVPHCVDEFLSMIPDKHELVVAKSDQLIKFLESAEFVDDMVPKLKSQHEVEISIVQGGEEDAAASSAEEDVAATVTLRWTFTRNNAGGLRDAIEFLQSRAAAAGIDVTVIRGSIPRPKSDSFEESFQYFESKILQHPATPAPSESPTKSLQEDAAARERSTIFDRLRKPGSMSSISSFLDRRKNSSHSKGSFFKGSSNISKSSLISIESARSFNADRNPWNDSGVNLAEDEAPWPIGGRPSGGGGGTMHDGTFLATNVPQPGGGTAARHGPRASGDSGRSLTSHSTSSGYPGPGGPFR